MKKWTLWVDGINAATIFSDDWGTADYIGCLISLKIGNKAVSMVDVVPFGDLCPQE